MQVQISAGRALKEMTVYTIGPGLVCKCMGQCTLGVQNFFNLFLKLTRDNQKSHV